MSRTVLLIIIMLSFSVSAKAQVAKDTLKTVTDLDSVTAINLMPSQEAELAYNLGIEKMKIGD